MLFQLRSRLYSDVCQREREVPLQIYAVVNKPESIIEVSHSHAANEKPIKDAFLHRPKVQKSTRSTVKNRNSR